MSCSINYPILMLDSTLAMQDINQELLLNEAEATHLPEDSQNSATSFYTLSSGTGGCYPPDGNEFMWQNGPIDQQYIVPGMNLIILEQWDACFTMSTAWEIFTHMLWVLTSLQVRLILYQLRTWANCSLIHSLGDLPFNTLGTFYLKQKKKPLI